MTHGERMNKMALKHTKEIEKRSSDNGLSGHEKVFLGLLKYLNYTKGKEIYMRGRNN